jgi:hypothetical protein
VIGFTRSGTQKPNRRLPPVTDKIARRPSPPSLKQQALAVLNDSANRLDGAHENIIRRALEALDD